MTTPDGIPGAAGAYGQQPPVPPPGYGPPQQQPPVPPQGYGPPQPQAPYQQQQQPSGWQPQQPPYQQPPSGYGYAQPAPSGPAKKSNTGLIVLLVVVMIVLVGAGGGAWYMFFGSPSNNVLWTVPAYERQSGADQVAHTRGTWFTDKAVVHAVRDGVRAYDLESGKELWGTPLPGAGNQTCVAPAESNGDIGIVGYGKSEACDHMAAYDLKSGKKLWDRDLGAKERTSQYDVEVARTGDVVVVSAGGPTLALKASDGTPAWDPKRFATGGCETGRFTGGNALIRVRGCSKGEWPDEKLWDEVALIDPATGAAQWTYRHAVPGDDHELNSGGNVLSTSPIVILRDGEDGEALFSLDDKTGKLRSEFSPATPAEYVQTWDADGSPWAEAGAFGSTFVMSVKAGNDNGLLAAYDLDSGKQLWKTKPAKMQDYFPLPAAGGGRILVYVTSNDNDKGPELVEFGAKDGAMNSLIEYPKDVDKGMSTFAKPYWHENTLFVSAEDAPITFGDEKAYSLAALPTPES